MVGGVSEGVYGPCEVRKSVRKGDGSDEKGVHRGTNR